MRFDWRKFCDRYGVAYVTSSPNTARGNISIHCPFCGAADKSKHLGLKLDVNDPLWGCLRNSQHGGKHPAYLVAALLQIHIVAAKQIVKLDETPIDAFEAAVMKMRPGNDEPETDRAKARISVLEFPKEARPLTDGGMYAERFLDYLRHTRDFKDDAVDVATKYRLRYAITGEQAWRLIIPVYDGNKLIAYTGREIRDGGMIRYRTNAGFDKNVLLERPRVAKVIAVCEGPLDWLKIDYYGEPFGVRAVATMGTGVTDAQIYALHKLQKGGIKMVMLFDPTAISENLTLSNELNAPWAHLPPGVEDPGALSPKDAKIFCRGLAK